MTAVPIVVPVGMRALLPALARRLGPRRGHLTGPLGAAGTDLAPELRTADPAVLATAAGAAVVSDGGEELLWRGLFVAAFPTIRCGAGCGQRPGSPPGTWRRKRCRRA